MEILEIYTPYRVYWQIETPLADKLSHEYHVSILYYVRNDLAAGYVFLKTEGLVRAVNQICAKHKMYYIIKKITENRFEDPDWLKTNRYRKP